MAENPEMAEATTDVPIETKPTSEGMEVGADGEPEMGDDLQHDFSDDDTDAEEIDEEVAKDALLPNMLDHFSLPKESCMVRSRKKSNGVRV